MGLKVLEVWGVLMCLGDMVERSTFLLLLLLLGSSIVACVKRMKKTVETRQGNYSLVHITKKKICGIVFIGYYLKLSVN